MKYFSLTINENMYKIETFNNNGNTINVFTDLNLIRKLVGKPEYGVIYVDNVNASIGFLFEGENIKKMIHCVEYFTKNKSWLPLDDFKAVREKAPSRKSLLDL